MYNLKGDNNNTNAWDKLSALDHITYLQSVIVSREIINFTVYISETEVLVIHHQTYLLQRIKSTILMCLPFFKGDNMFLKLRIRQFSHSLSTYISAKQKGELPYKCTQTVHFISYYKQDKRNSWKSKMIESENDKSLMMEWLVSS